MERCPPFSAGNPPGLCCWARHDPSPQQWGPAAVGKLGAPNRLQKWRGQGGRRARLHMRTMTLLQPFPGKATVSLDRLLEPPCSCGRKSNSTKRGGLLLRAAAQGEPPECRATLSRLGKLRPDRRGARGRGGMGWDETGQSPKRYKLGQPGWGRNTFGPSQPPLPQGGAPGTPPDRSIILYSPLPSFVAKRCEPAFVLGTLDRGVSRGGHKRKRGGEGPDWWVCFIRNG